ncbi:15094_t:CDS:2 [Dentiscutata erythropus]|uniref:15094_t:CDS:1 n=1 Tax=Dentiscutata erythropus TaxID=1348616 RepID=A0A9N9IAI4_9GLOM|nr:15094_t:CDS:2 [Dentiscutata erythropus]
MEIDNEKNNEPSDSEYDTAEEEPDIHFEKIKDPYINRIAEARKFNEGEVCDYYAFVPKGYYAEGEPLAFFESIKEKIADIYKKELALKGGLKIRFVLYAYIKKIKLETPEPLYKTFPFKHETIEIIREDQINATIEKGYNKIIDQIEDEALQKSGWSFVRAEEIFLEISIFRPLQGSSYLLLPEALDKPQLEIINPQNRDDNERNANIANFEGIKFPATLHNIDKFEESNPNYAINIFKLVYREAFGKIKVDIDLLHISEHNYQVEHMIDLLYLIEGEESLNDRKNQNDIPEGLKTHYVYITDFDRLDLLQKHILTCPGSNKASQCLILPEKIAVSYGYTIHCLDKTMQKPVINRESKNIIKDLMENLQEDLEVILDKLREIAPCEKMIPELWRKYQTANKC